MMNATFTFYTETRSSWRKSLDKAVQLVLDGKMTRDEFLAASRPSPDARDPLPEARLEAALATKAERDRRAAEWQARQQREADERKAKIDALRDAQVWALGGFYLEEMGEPEYTLAELQEWADSYGYVFAGRLGGEPAFFHAIAPTHNLDANLNHDASSDRKFSFSAALAHLRKWIEERRSR